jgi:hypothetical protein
MHPIIDPRTSDLEDDRSSTKRRRLMSLAGERFSLQKAESRPIWMVVVAIDDANKRSQPLRREIGRRVKGERPF